MGLVVDCFTEESDIEYDEEHQSIRGQLRETEDILSDDEEDFEGFDGREDPSIGDRGRSMVRLPEL